MTILLRRLPDVTEAGATVARWLLPEATIEPRVVLASARHAELVGGARPLTLVAARLGRVIYDVASRSVAVDDDAFLVLNAGLHGAAVIHAPRAVECTQLYFPAWMVDDVMAVAARSLDALLADPHEPCKRTLHIPENLIRHDRLVSPVLRYIEQCVHSEQSTSAWLDEQLHYLLHRLLLVAERRHDQIARVDCVRPATRLELFRRVAQAADYIDSNFERAFGLQELAQVACLSRFHLLRLFRQIYGVTPQSYKEQKRVLVARRLLAAGGLSRAEVAERVGYSTRTSLRTQLQRWNGSADAAVRDAQQVTSARTSSQVSRRDLATF
jgi:AraC family transcriptional regulator